MTQCFRAAQNYLRTWSQTEPPDEHLFHKDIFLSQSLVIVQHLLTEIGSNVRLIGLDDRVMQKDSMDTVFRLKLSQYVVQSLGI
jgi:hypothetical protein